ncbi:Uncharacterised protein [Clostridium sporogenes]|nr:hypothetical protein [Clostridium sporogenes]SUY60580.1 Uncharacterised protein [Clostridium sporogenes]
MTKLKNKKATKPSKKINSNEIKGSYKFKYLKFNFSFLSTNSDYNLEKLDEHIKADLIDRMEELSSITYLQLASMPKSRGFEGIKESSFSIKANYKKEKFNEEDFRNSCDKYNIIRLYPNNNPLPVRLIGKLSNNVFYLLFIDKEHKCYK